MGDRAHREKAQQVDLLRAELGELVDALPAPPDRQPFATHILPSSDPMAELGRHVERAVFGEFFGNSPELLAEEYGRYEPASLFLCVVDHRRRVPAGVMRVILPSDAGLKSLDDIERIWEQPLDEVLERTGLELDRGRVWDVATLAVGAGYRGAKSDGVVSLGLYQALATISTRCEAGWWVAVLDVAVLDLLQNFVDRPFSYFDGVEPMSYLDSPSSVPVWCEIPEWSKRFAQVDRSTWELLCTGTGLEPAVAPPDWEDAVARVTEFAPLRTATRTR